MKVQVLIVDDDQSLTEGLRRRLHDEPYQVLTATSALAALEVLSRAPIGAVVVDEHMPAGKGSELVAFLAKHRPELPCIMLTGMPSTALAIKAVNLGNVVRFFTKPCNVVELAIAIRESLALHHERTGGEQIERADVAPRTEPRVYRISEPKESLEQLIDEALQQGLLEGEALPSIPVVNPQKGKCI